MGMSKFDSNNGIGFYDREIFEICEILNIDHDTISIVIRANSVIFTAYNLGRELITFTKEIPKDNRRKLAYAFHLVYEELYFRRSQAFRNGVMDDFLQDLEASISEIRIASKTAPSEQVAKKFVELKQAVYRAGELVTSFF